MCDVHYFPGMWNRDVKICKTFRYHIQCIWPWVAQFLPSPELKSPLMIGLLNRKGNSGPPLDMLAFRRVYCAVIAQRKGNNKELQLAPVFPTGCSQRWNSRVLSFILHVVDASCPRSFLVKGAKCKFEHLHFELRWFFIASWFTPLKLTWMTMEKPTIENYFYQKWANFPTAMLLEGVLVVDHPKTPTEVTTS